MPITYDEHTAALSGRIGAEECQDLMTWLQSNPQAAVDLSAVEHLHAAALQCLMALRPSISSPPADERLLAVIKSTCWPADTVGIAQESSA